MLNGVLAMAEVSIPGGCVALYSRQHMPRRADTAARSSSCRPGAQEDEVSSGSVVVVG